MTFRLSTSTLLATTSATLATLLITGCEAAPESDGRDPEGGGPAGSADEEVLEAPDPQGEQLSHDEMREVLSDQVSEARLTDTNNYMAGLRDVETELARLVVDPQDCKQYVVQSASPVPEGSLVVFADNTAPEGGGADEQGGAGGAEEEDAEEDGSGDAGQPESRGGGGELAFSAGSAPLALPFENEDELEGSEENETEGADEQSSDEEAAEEETEVDVDLPEHRQVTVYSFQDALSAEAHFSNELDGLENCSTYTSQRPGGEGEEQGSETESSISEVEVDSAAEDAVGMTRELSYDGTSDHSVIVMLREGAHVVALGVPVQEELEEDEAEVAVEDLEEETAGILEDLIGEELG